MHVMQCGATAQCGRRTCQPALTFGVLCHAVGTCRSDMLGVFLPSPLRESFALDDKNLITDQHQHLSLPTNLRH